MPRRLTQDEFLEKCRDSHGEKYDYSITVYKGMNKPIDYICPKHGKITQSARDHSKGHGCIFCARERAHLVKLSTKEEFIKQSCEIHGNKYDYSKVDYYNNDTPVIIICPIHGEFKTTPHRHKRGQGCPECCKITKEKFLRRAREKFGWKYDYSKMDYINYTTEICIIHPKYGEFYQTPKNHLNSKTGYIVKEEKEKLKKKTKAEKLQDAFWESVKGREYDYSEVSFCTKSDKIIINCPIHGRFEQLVSTHMKGGKCPKCNIKRDTKEIFIKKARKVHGNKYDYSNVIYESSSKAVSIICHKKDATGKEHGVFWQKPNTHLLGHGCPKCYGRNKSTEQWISEAILAHPYGKYSFEKTHYTHARDKVIITCNEHGDFEITAKEFLRGHGCPKCQQSKLENIVEFALQQEEVEYETHKKMPWLLGMSIDFFIPEKRIAIECQGEQHYFDKEFFNKRETLKERQMRDSRKRELCAKNNIELLYFLEPKFLRYENSENKTFTNTKEMIEYIKRIPRL